jgi:hypothetical protein
MVDLGGLELGIRYRPRAWQTIEVNLGPPGIQRQEGVSLEFRDFKAGLNASKASRDVDPAGRWIRCPSSRHSM